MRDDDERVTELEIRSAYQEQTIMQLNDALVRQQRQIDALLARMKWLEERLGQQQPTGDDAALAAPYTAAEERPPHY